MNCNAPVELLFVQDLTASFADYLESWQQNAHQFTKELDSRLPDTTYSIASFRDKPFPFLGYGWGDYKDRYLKDYCYRLHTDGFVSESVFAEDIMAIPTASGGNDGAENQFEAMMNGIYDSALNWSSGDDVIKMMVLVTNSNAHGVNLTGKPKQSGGKWSDTANLTRGWDYWWAAKYFRESYGRQYLADRSDNNPYQSFVWDTASQFYYHKNCDWNSVSMNNYTILGEKIDVYGINSLNDSEKERWAQAMKDCTPVDPYQYIGVADEDELAERLHPNRFVGDEECLDFEYPNQKQVAEALRSKGVYPVVVSMGPKTSGEEGNDNTPWLKFAYGCTKSKEIECVAEFYSDIFASEGLEHKSTILHADSQNSYEQWSEEMFKIIEQAVAERCEKQTTTSTQPEVTTTGEGCLELSSLDPVCDTTKCETFINKATWALEYPNGNGNVLAKGMCTRFHGCC